jgi:hypothetical protein
MPLTVGCIPRMRFKSISKMKGCLDLLMNGGAVPVEAR